MRNASKAKALGGLLLAFLLLLLPLQSVTAESTDTGSAQEEPEGYVVMSIEKLTLGQGYILEPQKIPFYSGENLAQVTDRALTQYAKRKYMNTGSLESGFYLSDVEDPDRTSIDQTMPAYIKEMVNQMVTGSGYNPVQYTDTNDPEYLGEFDYFSTSGWMYSVNHVFPPVGAADAEAFDGEVVRWQFSIVGMGADLGNTGFTPIESYSAMDKTELLSAIAEFQTREDLMAKEDLAAVYQRCMEFAADMTVQADTVKPYLEQLQQALGKNVITSITLPEGTISSRSVELGTSLADLQQYFPTWMTAQIDGNDVNLADITWQCSYYSPNASGSYVFTPVLPDTYKNYTVASGLPEITITVKGLAGDVDGDSKVTIRDISRMAASMGKTDRSYCDLNGDGSVNIRDFLLLLQQIFS